MVVRLRLGWLFSGFVGAVEVFAQHLGDGVGQRAHAIDAEAHRAAAADAGQLVHDHLQPLIGIERRRQAQHQ